MMVKELRLIEEFRDMNLEVRRKKQSMYVGTLQITSDFLVHIREAQEQDQYLQEALGQENEFRKDERGLIFFRDRICIPAKEELKEAILGEAHKSHMSFHPGATKMYQDLKKRFWWHGMKKDVAEYVARCLTCRKAKVEHLRGF